VKTVFSWDEHVLSEWWLSLSELFFEHHCLIEASSETSKIIWFFRERSNRPRKLSLSCVGDASSSRSCSSSWAWGLSMESTCFSRLPSKPSPLSSYCCASLFVDYSWRGPIRLANLPLIPWWHSPIQKVVQVFLVYRASHEISSQMAASYTPYKLSRTRAALSTNLESPNALILRNQIGNDHGWILEVPRVLNCRILIRLLRRWVLLFYFSVISCLYLARLNPGSFFHLRKLL